ncbi:E3 ubiquitin-protein ligase LRSAM1 [Sinocyclocheilus anshuiensis]|uniref:E3 ubiquitin-protein ligase LRSAM1 n=1 Tax=Sinocyclocheilus anshuiensis TaxID=1608454 RepID=UPI0007BA6748|nr:PREDICTED: E3 ubiquitin-protein ligase LRSAM1-like [Sinocyclocheilus anshuiensis]
MFLFSKKKKPSEDSIKRLEYQLCLAKEAGADDILDISACELAEVPSSAFSICKVLQKKVLILHGNDLMSLVPKGCFIGALATLKVLDLHENKLTSLPDDIGQLLSLQMSLEYCPPSQYLLPVLEHDEGKQEVDCVDGEEMAWQSKFMDYEKRKVQKQLEKLIFEKDLEEKRREHTQLLLLNNSHKEDVLLSVKLEQQRLELGVSQQQKAQETDRQKMLDKVHLAESNIMSRISDLLLDNKRQAKSGEFLQALEEDRIRMEHLTAITQDEANSLRKKEVASAMQRMLSESYSLRLLQEAREAKTQILLSETCKSLDYMDRKFDQVLSLQQLDKSKAISQILQEEEMQKAAFEALQLQKDSVHAYIRNQIKLIETELMQLTKLEVKRRNLDTENLQEVLADQRTALTDLLQQLLKQKDQREEELRMVLVEMAQKCESNQQNYWMIQYQRLLDAKPLSLRMQETAVDADLGNLLCKLSAQHYLPIIAHHRITAEALRNMTTKDLRKLGINEVGVQKALLHWARECTLSDPKEMQEAGPSTPSAPLQQQLTPPLTPSTPLTPTAPSPDSWSSSECVVCMEHESQVIFLPCGHVCCCQTCSDALQSCPLCRGSISQRVRLYHG